MAASITPAQAISDLEKGISIAHDTISGVNSVADAQGVTGAPEAAAQSTVAAATAPASTFGLQLGGTNGLLTRFLKVLIGGVLIIAGILKLTGKEDIVTKGGAKVAEGMLMA